MADDMPELFMPDPDQLPNGWTLSPVVQQHYKELPTIYRQSWDSMGKGEKAPAPKLEKISQVKGAEAAHIANYPEWVTTLDRKYQGILSDDQDIEKTVNSSAELIDAGKKAVIGNIDTLTTMAKINPANLESIAGHVKAGDFDQNTYDLTSPPDESRYAMGLVSSTTGTLRDLMDQLKAGLAEKAGEVGDGTKTKPDPSKQVKLTVGDNPAGEKEGQAPGNTTRPGTTPTTDTTVTPDATKDKMPDAWNWDGADSGSKDTPAGVDTTASSSQKPPTDDALAKIRDIESQANAAQQKGTTPSQGMSPSDYSLPMMMNALANRNAMANGNQQGMVPGRNAQMGGRPPVTGTGVPRGGEPAAGTQAAPAAAAKPAAGAEKETAAAKPGAPAGPPRVSSSGNTVTPVAATAPVDKDGNVVFTFEDGRSVRVSPVVHQALTAAVGNAATTDANKAYEQTPVKVPDGKAVDAQKDPSELMTGDVARWERRTALVVKFEDDGDPHLEVIVEGRLRRLEQNSGMSDKDGDFGPFSGFVHPPGIEPQPVGDSGVPTVIPVTSAAPA